MFRSDNEHLLPAERHERLAGNSYEILEYVYGLLERSGTDETTRRAKRPTDHDVVYHGHCQQRTLGHQAYTTAVLEQLGYDVATSRSECCGMAGSFRDKFEDYEPSMTVGSLLRDQGSGSAESARPRQRLVL